MLAWIIRRQIASFEQQYGYDLSYMRDLLDADLSAALRFAKVAALAEYCKDVPKDAWYAAKLVGTMAEDCGPCTQLVVTMAERDHVPAASLRALLAGEDDALPETMRLAARFARAVLARDPQADDLREEICRRWGRRGLVSLSFALTAARLFPTIKYALGRGRSCSKVQVGGSTVSVHRAA